MGFETGNILEPSCGVGNFFGMLPESMAGSKLYGVELDSISGRIARQLYPKADITVAGFENTDRRDFYDLAIAMCLSVSIRSTTKLQQAGLQHPQLLFRQGVGSGAARRCSGLCDFPLHDGRQGFHRAPVSGQRAELLGAIRLPNNAFRANAGTDVVSDIIFLQRRERPLDIL